MMCPLSSVVERLAVNQEVAGSIPAAGDALQVLLRRTSF